MNCLVWIFFKPRFKTLNKFTNLESRVMRPKGCSIFISGSCNLIKLVFGFKILRFESLPWFLVNVNVMFLNSNLKLIFASKPSMLGVMNSIVICQSLRTLSLWIVQDLQRSKLRHTTHHRRLLKVLASDDEKLSWKLINNFEMIVVAMYD